MCEMLDLHLAQLSRVEPRTVRDYLGIAQGTWLKPLGGLRVNELERADIAAWVNKAAGELRGCGDRDGQRLMNVSRRSAPGMTRVDTVTPDRVRRV